MGSKYGPYKERRMFVRLALPRDEYWAAKAQAGLCGVPLSEFSRQAVAQAVATGFVATPPRVPKGAGSVEDEADEGESPKGRRGRPRKS
jgi:hypothetical protein